MRRKLAILLVFILALTSLAGCSQAELGYLDMSRQLQSAEEYRTTGTVTGEVNVEALLTLVDKTMKKASESDPYSFYDPYYVDDARAQLAEIGLTGTQKAAIYYDILIDMKDNLAFQMDLDFALNGKTYELGDLYFDGAGSVYVSKDLIIGIYDIYKDFSLNKWDSYYYSKEYRDELLQVLGSNPYISMDSTEDLSSEISMQLETTGMLSQELNEAAFNFIDTAFSGFTTGAVSTVSGGYRISLNGTQMKNLIADGLQYAMDNTEKIMNAYRDLTVVLIEMMPELSEAERAEAIAEIDIAFGQNSQIMISSYLAMAKQAFLEADKAGYLSFMNGLGYDATIKKAGDKYVSQEDLTLRDGSKTVFSLKSESETVAQPVEINMPDAKTPVGDLEAPFMALENKLNPVQNVIVNWWNGDSSYLGRVGYERAKVSPFNGSSTATYESYIIQESRLYVPMRSIAESFGEQVTWDGKAKKAYVVRDGSQIEMSGILKDGRTFIKVIDFEKLGYKVSYEYDKFWGEHTAYISR